MTKKRGPQEPEVVCVGSTPIRRITAEERRKIAQRIKKQRKQLREKYPEVHGKVVDFWHRQGRELPILYKCPTTVAKAAGKSAGTRSVGRLQRF